MADTEGDVVLVDEAVLDQVCVVVAVDESTADAVVVAEGLLDVLIDRETVALTEPVREDVVLEDVDALAEASGDSVADCVDAALADTIADGDTDTEGLRDVLIVREVVPLPVFVRETVVLEDAIADADASGD